MDRGVGGLGKGVGVGLVCLQVRLHVLVTDGHRNVVFEGYPRPTRLRNADSPIWVLVDDLLRHPLVKGDVCPSMLRYADAVGGILYAGAQVLADGDVADGVFADGDTVGCLLMFSLVPLIDHADAGGRDVDVLDQALLRRCLQDVGKKLL